MERPMGPRAPPVGDRNRAFETIFGRPSAAHHIPQPNQQQPPHSQRQGYGLQPPQGGPSARAPSPLGYPGYVPPPQAAGQQFRAQQDARYPYAAPPQQIHQQQESYPPFQPVQGQPRPQQYPTNEGYLSDIRQPPPLDQSSYNARSSYAQSLPPGQFQPTLSLRTSIQYSSGAMASVDAPSDQGYQSSSTSAPFAPDGMTPAQAYQAQVVRSDPRLGQIYEDQPPRVPPPRAYSGRISGAPPFIMQPGASRGNPTRPQSMQHLGSSAKANPPSLPPVDGFEPLDMEDVLEGPHMTNRKYPLRRPLDSDTKSLAESLGSAMLDSPQQSHPPPPPLPHLDHGINYELGRFMQNSPPPSSPSFDTNGTSLNQSTTALNRMSNDSTQTMPSLNSTAKPPQHHRRSSTTDGSLSGRPSLASSSTATARPSPQSVRAMRGPTSKAMPPLPRQSLPSSMMSSSGAQAARNRAYVKPVYPALLSRVAEAFQMRISLAERAKDGLAYKDAFDGREAVSKLAEIIKTTDRNLALLLGRALDAQKFFHDVTYDHRLRDSANEVYQFRTALPTPFMSGDELAGAAGANGQQGPGMPPGGVASNGIGNGNGNGSVDNLSRPNINPVAVGQQGIKSLSSSTTNTSVDTYGNGAQDGALPTLPNGPSTSESAGALSPVSTNEDGTSLPPIPGDTPSVDSHAASNFDSDSILPEAARARIGDGSSTPNGTSAPAARPSPNEALDAATAAATAAASDELPLPSGVFTLLTECYSPTCTRDKLCYSIACPRRLEQQARLNLQPQPVLKRAISQESLGDLVEPGTLWIHSVSQEVADSVSEKERKRQEAINEVIYTERDFVRDMEYLRDQWIIPLSTRDIIPENRRKDFVTQVFWNVHEIIAVNIRLRDALTKRQKHRPVVDQIGDILLEHVQRFEPFVKYGSHQLYGKYEFEKEKNSNPAFSQFVDEVERLPESRKLELNGYLTKPTTRLARYPLLLEVCLKSTEEDNPDKITLPKAVKFVRGFLERVNVESGRTENRFNLLQLDQQLVFRPGEAEDLRLLDENRELVYKGPLKRSQGDNTDLQLFLFDHALLVVKAKSKHEQFKPIPLELLLISPTAEDPGSLRGGIAGRPRNTLVSKRNSTGSRAAGMHPLAPVPSDKPDPKGGFPITFIHLGRKGYSLTLWASTFISRKKWIDSIVKQQEALRERSTIFEPWTISQGFFSPMNRVNCAAPLNRGQVIVFGTDDGVYFANLREPQREPVKMLALAEVTQVDVLEDYQLLIVLSERAVITFPLDALDPRDPLAGLKRAKRVSSHTSFFKAGICLGRMLVCVVKASALSTTIKTLEPIEQNLRGKNKPTFKKLLQGGNDTLRVFKEFYIPVESSSIHFLRTRLCVGCTKGFEIVDLETLDAQGLLDPNDPSLDFVLKRDSVRPMAIYRVDSEFLLCYEDFAFYINKNGWRSRPGWIIHWEGMPTAFALHYPYVLAFEPTFIEVRHVETGLMAQVIAGTSVSCLFADTPPSADSAAPHHHPQHIPPGYGPPGHPSHIAARQSMYNGYGQPPRPGFPGPPRRDLMHKRDEIILSMDDKVVGIRRAQLPRADTASTFSTVPSYATLPR